MKANGEVVFYTEDSVFEKATESGFKVHQIELLDNFIEYRGQCNELPNKEGVGRFIDGGLSIEWLLSGSTEFF